METILLLSFTIFHNTCGFQNWRTGEYLARHILSNQVQAKIFDGLLLSAMWVNIVIQLILFLINILGYDKHMKGYDKYITGYDKYIISYDKYITSYDKHITSYDKYITSYDKYINGYLEKIFAAITNIFTATPKKYLWLLWIIYGYFTVTMKNIWVHIVLQKNKPLTKQL